jgi:hypothetical protein
MLPAHKDYRPIHLGSKTDVLIIERSRFSAEIVVLPFAKLS